jgi:uncharacterized protein YidB (DUF937 family)
MSIFGQLEGQFGNLLASHQADLGGLFQDALASAGGYQGILNKLNQAGLGNEVQSWLATNGKNLPISASQIQAALGDEHIQQLAKSFGVPVDQVANLLAQHLPAAVDQASPGGAIQAVPR